MLRRGCCAVQPEEQECGTGVRMRKIEGPKENRDKCQVLSGVSSLLSGLFSFDVECCVLPGRCTARALVCWREHAKAQRRVFGVARKVAERMLHRYRTRIDDERGHHHGRSFDGLRFLALILFNLSVTKLIRNIRLQSFKKITAVTVLYAFVNLHDNCFTTRNAPFLSS